MRFFLVCLIACDSPPAPAGATLAPPAEHDADGITCASTEQLLFHIHAHLTIFVGSAEKLLPGGIGIGPPLQYQNDFVVGGSCFSWLHTHDQTGVIHIESPEQRVFTVGNFFDVWGQPLSASAVGPASGKVTAWYNGQRFTDDPRTMPLNNHDQLQLDVGTPAPSPVPYLFPPGL